MRQESAQTDKSWLEDLVTLYDRAQAELHRRLEAEGDAEEWL